MNYTQVGLEARTLGLRTEPSSSDPYLWHIAMHQLILQNLAKNALHRQRFTSDAHVLPHERTTIWLVLPLQRPYGFQTKSAPACRTPLTCMQVLLTTFSSSCGGLLEAGGALEVRNSKGVEGVVGVRALRVQDVCAEPAQVPSPFAWMPSHGIAVLAERACLKGSTAVYSLLDASAKTTVS